MAGNRSEKVAQLIQKDLAEIFVHEGNTLAPGVMVSVTRIRMSPDLGSARIYISIFPSDDAKEKLNGINQNKSKIRGELGKRTRHQLRVVPELHFYLDDSLDYEENIDRLLRGEGENPIE